MGLFPRPRRPLLRLAAGAATATVAYRAGQRRAEQDAYNEQAQAAHSGALELEDLRPDPTGRRLELRGMLIAEFEGDRIKRFRQYWDEVALLERLGLLPED